MQSSVEEKVLQDRVRSLTSVQQLYEKLNRIDCEYSWLTTKKLDSAAFYIIETVSFPKMTHSVGINENLLLKVYTVY